jgi:HEPN domain-containing protein
LVHVTLRELERAFRGHAQFLEANKTSSTSASYRLILFYAVECGIKALFLRRNGLSSTEDLTGDNKISHDLRTGLNRLRAPGTVTIPDRVRVNPPRTEALLPKEWHEAWRYGIEFEAASESTTVSALTNALAWLKAEMR